MKNTALINLALLSMLGLLWGSGYVIANYCVRHGVHPLGYALWQSVGPALLLLLISWFRTTKTLCFNKKHLGYYIVCGFLGIALPNSLIYFSSKHLPAGIIGVIANIVPLLVYPLAILMRQEKFAWQRLLAVFIGFFGVMLMVSPNLHIVSGIGVPWILLLLITPISFAICAVYIVSARPVPSDSLGLSTGMLIFSSALLVPVIYFTHSFYKFKMPFHLTDWLIMLEIILSTVGYIVFFVLIKRAGAVYYSFVSGVVALTSLVWGWLFLHEALTTKTMMAAILIIAAIYWMSFWLARYEKSHS